MFHVGPPNHQDVVLISLEALLAAQDEDLQQISIDLRETLVPCEAVLQILRRIRRRGLHMVGIDEEVAEADLLPLPQDPSLRTSFLA